MSIATVSMLAAISHGMQQQDHQNKSAQECNSLICMHCQRLPDLLSDLLRDKPAYKLPCVMNVLHQQCNHNYSLQMVVCRVAYP